jgi:AraC-like DNA-binding protein
MPRPRMRMIRHESPLMRFEIAFSQPSPELRGFVAEYVGWIDRSPTRGSMRELPSANIPLIIYFDARVRHYHLMQQSHWAEHSAFTAGLHDIPTLVESTGPGGGIQVNFTVLGARLFLARPLNDLTNLTVDLSDVLGAEASRLTAELADAPEWQERFAILDREISFRIHRAHHPAAAITWAWERLVRTGGRISISDLRKYIGWSERHFARQFREEVGLTPKAFARVVRFNHAVRKLTNGQPRLVDVALDCGYYDQAHFARDFRALSGVTPSELLASRQPEDSQFVFFSGPVNKS